MNVRLSQPTEGSVKPLVHASAFALMLVAGGLVLLAWAHHLSTVSYTQATLGDQTYDFGTAREGEHISHIFRLSNPGGAPLTLTRMSPSCACTVPELQSTTIAPHGWQDLRVDVKLGMSGKFGSNVALFFDQHDPVKLNISGKVIYQFPEKVTFDPCASDHAPTRDVVIRSINNDPLHLRSLAYDRRKFNVISDLADSKNIHLVVNICSGQMGGNVSDVLRVETDDDVDPVKTISLEGYIFKDLEVKPGQLLFGVLSPGGTKKIPVTIYSPYRRAISLRGVATSRARTRPMIACDLADVKNLDSATIEIPFIATGGITEGDVVHESTDLTVKIGSSEQKISLEWYFLIHK